MYAKGVDGLYLFNLEYSDRAAQRGIYAGALFPENVTTGYRRYIATCDDVPSKIMKPHEKALLSACIGRAVEIPVWAGRSQPVRRVEVVLGFDSEDVPAEKMAVTLNGRANLGFVEEHQIDQYGGTKRWTCMRSHRVFRWRFPTDAFATGPNRISFTPVEGAKARICWCEIALDTPEQHQVTGSAGGGD